MNLNPDDLELIRRILLEWVETFKDEKTFPVDEYTTLWKDIARAETFLERTKHE